MPALRLANSRAIRRMSRAGTPLFASAHSGVYFSSSTMCFRMVSSGTFTQRFQNALS